MGKGPIHVAGVKDAEEAEMLIYSGFTHLGFPLVLDRHAEDLSPAEASEIITKCAPRATFFLITYLDRAGDVASLCRELSVGMVQLHGDISLDEIKRLRAMQPSIHIIKSLVVTGDNTEMLLDDVSRFAPLVDSFITDTFDPLTGARGATGKIHDWTVSRRLVEASPRPVILAGGLNPNNVREAIHAVHPAGVDVHTGIEGPDGRKSRALAARFVEETQAAFAEIGSQ